MNEAEETSPFKTEKTKRDEVGIKVPGPEARAWGALAEMGKMSLTDFILESTRQMVALAECQPDDRFIPPLVQKMDIDRGLSAKRLKTNSPSMRVAKGSAGDALDAAKRLDRESRRKS